MAFLAELRCRDARAELAFILERSFREYCSTPAASRAKYPPIFPAAPHGLLERLLLEPDLQCRQEQALEAPHKFRRTR